MNLVDQPWIPVVDKQGKHSLIGLLELFQNSETYIDLVLPVGQRIAIMRFLLSLVYASLNGPKDFNEWKSLASSYPMQVIHYLNQNKHLFNLFDPAVPFMQINEIEAHQEGFAPIEKLDMNLSAGSSQTLFDNQGGLRKGLSKDHIARILITIQHFCLNGRTSKISWKSWISAESAKRSPMFGTIHSFLIGSTLQQTVHLNLLTLEDVNYSDWGPPSWKNVPQNHEEASKLSASFMGSLMPWRRFIKLKETCEETSLGASSDERDFQDLYLSIETNLKTESAFEFLGAKEKCELWRQMGGVLFKKDSEDIKIRRPFHFHRLREKCSQGAFDIWVGCIHAFPGFNAKIVSIQESRYHLSAGWADDEGEHRIYYEKWLEACEQICKKLKDKIDRYYRNLFNEKKSSALTKSKKDQAESLFWNKVTEFVPNFFRLATRDQLDHWLNEWPYITFSFCKEIENQLIQTFNSRSYKAWALSQNQRGKK